MFTVEVNSNKIRKKCLRYDLIARCHEYVIFTLVEHSYMYIHRKINIRYACYKMIQIHHCISRDSQCLFTSDCAGLGHFLKKTYSCVFKPEDQDPQKLFLIGGHAALMLTKANNGLFQDVRSQKGLETVVCRIQPVRTIKVCTPANRNTSQPP